jgi:hypothetical protein
MRDLVRTGGSALLLVAIMFLGGLVLWIGVPVAWLYVGSQVQVATDSLSAAIAAMAVGVLVSIGVIVALLGWLNLKHEELREARGLESYGATALEAVLVVSAGIALVSFGAWFFLFSGADPAGLHRAPPSRRRRGQHGRRRARREARPCLRRPPSGRRARRLEARRGGLCHGGIDMADVGRLRGQDRRQRGSLALRERREHLVLGHPERE